jgi:hypothetical protein
MGFDSLIRGLVKSVISPSFETMKMTVTVTPWIGEGPSGKKLYGTPYTLRALVDYEGRAGTQRYTNNGSIVVPMCILTFVDLPLPETTPNAGQQRQNPIDNRDIIQLPDGSTAPVVDMSGFGDPQTQAPYAPTVTLGVVMRGQ